MKTFKFDVKLFATLNVEANTEKEARAILWISLDCADANFGAWPDGTPILGEASMDGEPDLVEDDEQVTP